MCAPARSGDVQPAVPVEIGNGHIHINAGDGRSRARHPCSLAGAQPELDAALKVRRRVGGHDIDVAVAVDVRGPDALVGVDFDRALAGLPAPAALVEHDPDAGGLALNTVNDVGQPVFVHVGQRHGAHIALHRQGLGLGQAAGPVAIADGDRTGFAGAGHHVEVTVFVQVGNRNGQRFRRR